MYPFTLIFFTTSQGLLNLNAQSTYVLVICFHFIIYDATLKGLIIFI